MRVAAAAVWCLSGVLAFGPAVAQEPLARVSLDDALQLALRQNPTLRAQQFALGRYWQPIGKLACEPCCSVR